jgi:hypothetical protein
MSRILILPGDSRSALSCRWSKTGNPKQPLVRTWVDSDDPTVSSRTPDQERAQPCCA